MYQSLWVLVAVTVNYECLQLLSLLLPAAANAAFVLLCSTLCVFLCFCCLSIAMTAVWLSLLIRFACRCDGSECVTVNAILLLCDWMLFVCHCKCHSLCVQCFSRFTYCASVSVLLLVCHSLCCIPVTVTTVCLLQCQLCVCHYKLFMALALKVMYVLQWIIYFWCRDWFVPVAMDTVCLTL